MPHGRAATPGTQAPEDAARAEPTRAGVIVRARGQDREWRTGMGDRRAASGNATARGGPRAGGAGPLGSQRRVEEALQVHFVHFRLARLEVVQQPRVELPLEVVDEIEQVFEVLDHEQ